ncbi:MAG: hypothetical protein AAGC67_14880 [Myxococcota bacterium]
MHSLSRSDRSPLHRRAERPRVVRFATAFDLAVGFVALLTVGLAVSPALADWSEDFDGAFDQAWTFVALDDVGDPPSTGFSTFSRIEAGVDDHLRIAHSTTAFADGGGGATDGFGFVSELFFDVAMSAELNAAPADGQQSVLGVLARGSLLSGTAYVAGVSFADDLFVIARNDNTVDFLVPLATDPGLGLDPNANYVVLFWLDGASLNAALVDAATSEVLSNLSATDFNYASGVSGVLVQTAYDVFDVPVGPIVGTFDNVRAVPEPRFAIGLAAACAGFAGSVRARRRGWI